MAAQPGMFKDLADVEATCRAMYDVSLPEHIRKAAEERLAPLTERRDSIPLLEVRRR